MKKIYLLIIALFIATVVLEGFNIYLTNGVNTDSIQATDLRNAIAEVDEKNQNLHSEILEFTSFDSVASRAATLGFEGSRESISLHSPVEVASTQ